MIVLSGQVSPVVNQSIQIECEAGKFSLIVRPVSDDDQLREQGLMERYYLARDPEEAARFYAARYRLLLTLIVGWEGVVVESATGPVPVKFTDEALGSLLATQSVGLAVARALAAYFNDGFGGAGQRKKGESEESPGVSSPGGSTESPTLTKSISSPGG